MPRTRRISPRYVMTVRLGPSRRRVLQSAGAMLGRIGLLRTHSAHAFPPEYIMMSDPLRPWCHYIAPYGWMNDPCGPICVDGTYHLFYQWNPDEAVWGNMHWGHATSRDLVHWEQHGAAMAPRPGMPDEDGVFTGDVVMDGSRAIALYTGNRNNGTPLTQVQCIASSDAGMRHWEQDPHPVLAEAPEGLHLRGFRDPKLWKEGDVWSMIVGASIEGAGGVVFRYESHDLHHWVYRGIFYGPSELRGGDDALECPDFFQLGDYHVLIFSIDNVVHAVSGHYEQGTFTPVLHEPLGHGPFYAARTLLDAQGRRTMFGWIPEKPWQADAAARRGWSGAMSLPRVLSAGADGRVHSALHPNMSALNGKTLFSGPLTDGVVLPGPCMRLRLTFPGKAAGTLLFARTDRYVHLDYDPHRAGSELQCNEDAAPLPVGAALEIDILVDASVIEIFTSAGTVLNARAYGDPAGPFTLSATGCFEGAHCEAVILHPISPDRLASVR